MDNIPDDSQTFLQFIGDNYDQEKSKLKHLCSGFNDILFDEDIYHDTIIKINDTFDVKHFDKSIYDKYLCKSFRTNLVRDKLYHRNSMVDHPDTFEGIEPYTFSYIEQTIDFELVIKMLNRQFGESQTNAFVDWLSGFSVKEASDKNNIDSGYYHIKQMTNYIRKYHKHNELIY